MSPRRKPTPSANDPAAEAAARFTRDLTALTGGDDAVLGIAVSGGPDSLALLLLAEAACPGKVRAATVDHGLRTEAAAEAEMVAKICAARGIPHSILRPSAPITGSMQSAARTARYALLERWREDAGIDWLLTAHHADDQAETLLMRLNRGSGVAGLSAIRARRGRIIRPLLGWRRGELADIVAAAGLAPVDDPANRDFRFDRARVRAAIAGADWLYPERLAHSAALIGEAEDALEWVTARLAAERITGDEDGLTLDAAGLPAELQRRLLVGAIARLDPGAAPRGGEIDRLIAQLTAGNKATIGHLMLSGGDRWRLGPAPPRRKNAER